jgi:predicted Fe-Mo cluster-binding NifX family protein
MKIAVTSYGENLTDKMDRRFGRAQGFAVCDLEDESINYVSNKQNYNAAQGAGIQAAQNVSELGVDAVITGHCGPKAFSVLKAAGIKIYNCEAQTVQEAIQQYREDKLTEAGSADVDSHWV